MAGKNQDASKSNNHNGVQIGGPKDNGNVGHGNTGTANIGNENVGSHNVGNGNTGSNFVGDPLPGVDSEHPSSSQVLMRALTNSQMMQLTLGPKPRFYQ